MQVGFKYYVHIVQAFVAGYQLVLVIRDPDCLQHLDCIVVRYFSATYGLTRQYNVAPEQSREHPGILCVWAPISPGGWRNRWLLKCWCGVETTTISVQDA